VARPAVSKRLLGGAAGGKSRWLPVASGSGRPPGVARRRTSSLAGPPPAGEFPLARPDAHRPVPPGGPAYPDLGRSAPPRIRLASGRWVAPRCLRTETTSEQLPENAPPNDLPFCSRGMRRSRASGRGTYSARLRRGYAPVSSKGMLANTAVMAAAQPAVLHYR
jgi:hypothetical protein